VDELCRLANARKGSFYHFFPTKVDLALAALAFRWTELRRTVFDPVDQAGGPGLDRLRRLVERIDALQRREWAERQALGSPTGGLGQEMARQDERIRAAVHAVFEAQCGYLRRWLDEASGARQIAPGDNGGRSRQILALVEGALLLCKVAGDPGLFSDLCAAVPHLAGRLPHARPVAGTPPELS
jgi:TetR/AcrR family transcriptional regulator, transcriptional repressor for nem operon